MKMHSRRGAASAALEEKLNIRPSKGPSTPGVSQAAQDAAAGAVRDATSRVAPREAAAAAAFSRVGAARLEVVTSREAQLTQVADDAALAATAADADAALLRRTAALTAAAAVEEVVARLAGERARAEADLMVAAADVGIAKEEARRSATAAPPPLELLKSKVKPPLAKLAEARVTQHDAVVVARAARAALRVARTERREAAERLRRVGLGDDVLAGVAQRAARAGVARAAERAGEAATAAARRAAGARAAVAQLATSVEAEATVAAQAAAAQAAVARAEAAEAVAEVEAAMAEEEVAVTRLAALRDLAGDRTEREEEPVTAARRAVARTRAARAQAAARAAAVEAEAAARERAAEMAAEGVARACTKRGENQAYDAAAAAGAAAAGAAAARASVARAAQAESTLRARAAEQERGARESCAVHEARQARKARLAAQERFEGQWVPQLWHGGAPVPTDVSTAAPLARAPGATPALALEAALQQLRGAAGDTAGRATSDGAAAGPPAQKPPSPPAAPDVDEPPTSRPPPSEPAQRQRTATAPPAGVKQPAHEHPPPRDFGSLRLELWQERQQQGCAVSKFVLNGPRYNTVTKLK